MPGVVVGAVDVAKVELPAIAADGTTPSQPAFHRLLILAGAQVDLVVVLRAAEAGKHCLVEKPFTRTLAQADAAIRAAEAHQIQVMPVYNLQLTRANQKMKEFVNSDTLGPIYQACHHHGHREYTKNGFDARRVMNGPGLALKRRSRRRPPPRKQVWNNTRWKSRR